MTFDTERRVIRPGHPTNRVTFQFAGSLDSTADESAEGAFAKAVETAVGWLQGKFSKPLDLEAAAGRSFEAELPGQVVRCVAVLEDGLWTARLVQPDAPYMDQTAVAGRTWTTEVSFLLEERGVRVGVRAQCASLPYATEEIRLSRPHVLVDLATRFNLREARRVDGLPWRLATPGDLQEFRALLVDEHRALPVYLLTQPDRGRLGIQTGEFLLDADALARRTLGIAYVATMPTALSFHWTEMVGKPWSAYLGTVRTYRPGLRFEEDSPFDHPLSVAERVLAFQYRERKAEEAFLEMLVDQAHRHVSTMRVSWGGLSFLEDARIRRAELARESATDDSTRVARLREQVDALTQKVAGLKNDLDVAVEMASQVEGAKVVAEDEAHRLRVQLDALRRAFVQKTGTSPDSFVRVPQSFQEFEEWARAHLAGRLVLHPRALRELRDAAYEDPALAGRALLALADEYRDMQLGEPGAHEAFDAACKKLGLRFGRSIARERAGEEGETYFVRLGRGGPEKQFLEYHLRKGSGKDPRRCLGIYFLWDDVTQQVVVGWLPSHLDNRKS